MNTIGYLGRKTYATIINTQNFLTCFFFFTNAHLRVIIPVTNIRSFETPCLLGFDQVFWQMKNSQRWWFFTVRNCHLRWFIVIVRYLWDWDFGFESLDSFVECLRQKCCWYRIEIYRFFCLHSFVRFSGLFLVFLSMAIRIARVISMNGRTWLRWHLSFVSVIVDMKFFFEQNLRDIWRMLKKKSKIMTITKNILTRTNPRITITNGSGSIDFFDDLTKILRSIKLDIP